MSVAIVVATLAGTVVLLLVWLVEGPWKRTDSPKQEPVTPEWVSRSVTRSGPATAPEVGSREQPPPAPEAPAAEPVRPAVGEGDAPTVLLRVVDPGGEAIPGAVIFHNQPLLGPSEETTDAEGRYLLHFTGGELIDFVLVEAADFPPTGFRVFASGTEQLLELEPGVTLRGQVTDSLGSPVAGAAIRARAHRREYLHLGDDPLYRNTTSEAGGLFSIPDLPAGTIVVEASRRGYPPLQEIHSIDSNSSPLLLEFEAGLDLVVEVVDADAEKRPIEEAQITVRVRRLPEWPPIVLDGWTTDANGRVLIDSLPERRDSLVIAASAPGYLPGSQILDRSGIAREIRIELDPLNRRAATIRGEIVPEDGAPLPGEAVALFRDHTSMTWEQRAAIDRRGRFVMERVRAGIDVAVGFYWVPPCSATRVGPIGKTDTMQLEEGEVREVSIRLPPLPVAVFRARTVDDRPVTAVEVKLERIDKSPDHGPRSLAGGARGRTGMNGVLHLRVPAGRYTFTARRPPWQIRDEIRIGGEMETIDLVVDTGVPLRGRVVDSLGRTVADRGVVVMAPEFTQATWTDADGRFQVPVPEGELTVHVEGLHGEKYGVTRRVHPGNVEIVLPLESVEVRLVDARTGEPLEGSVQRGKDGTYITGFGLHEATRRTDASGVAVFGDLSHGLWHFEGRSPGYLPATATLELPHDLGRTLRLRPAASLEITGVPFDDVDEIALYLRHRTSELRQIHWHPRSSTSPPFDALPPGSWRLEAHIDGSVTTRELDLPAGERTRLPWRDLIEAGGER